MKNFIPLFIFLALFSCTKNTENNSSTITNSEVIIIGAMKNVMRKGELHGNIFLDTLANKNGLYGLGPVSFLTGEILVINGESYVSQVTSDTTMKVHKRYDISAPFFVYSYVSDWKEVKLSTNVKTINDLQDFIKESAPISDEPFVFQLKGKVSKALIHIQNLPKGTKVSSPEDAHKGQKKYTILDEEADIIGFYSTRHQGIFTHHDSYLHMHLITKNKTKMGHLDELQIDNMTLYLPN
ncbi:acetolactate decarboxylase [Marinigracilibium pacificum]|uniref:Acetolactate decarboxylase n=1 Tax=Marinigracilibium pacificum TaxID=2729599 RepID=A0A848J5D6_9BACT|nr:acetolactate decarboxylase [Marinigracilibium pacificum]NMM50685.1 acetolactate decarboxylase [Marinigracilibium pacificum]